MTEQEEGMALVIHPTAAIDQGSSLMPGHIPVHQAIKMGILDSIIYNVQSEICRGEKTRKHIEEELSKQRGLFEELKSRMTTMFDEKLEIESSMLTCQKRLTKSKEDEKKLSSENKSLQDEKEKLTQERDDCMRRLHHCESQIQSKGSEILSLKSKLDSNQSRLLLLEEANQVLQSQNDKLEKSLKNHEAKLHTLSSSVSRKSDEVSSLRNQLLQTKAEFSALECLNALSTANSERLLTELSKANVRYEREREARENSARDAEKTIAGKRALEDDALRLRMETEGLTKKNDALQIELAHEKQYKSSLEAEHRRTCSDFERRIQEAMRTKESEQFQKKHLEEDLESAKKQLSTLSESKVEAEREHGSFRKASSEEKSMLVEKQAKLEAMLQELELTTQKERKSAEATMVIVKGLEDSVKSKEEEVLVLKRILAEAEEKTRIAEKSVSDLKNNHMKALEHRKAELHSHLREISRRNNEAMAEMRKQFEAEATKTVEQERKKAQGLIEDNQKQHNQRLTEEQEKFSSRLKMQLEKAAAATSELEAKHKEELDSIIGEKESAFEKQKEDLATAVQALEAKLEERESSMNSHAAQVKELQEAASRYEKELADVKNELNANFTREREDYMKEMEFQIQSLTSAKTQSSANMEVLQKQYEDRFNEVCQKLKETESAAVAQHDRDQNSMKYMQTELEKCLREARQRSEMLEKKLKESMERADHGNKAMKQQLLDQQQQADEALRKAEEESAAQKAELEAQLEKAQMQQENFISKLKMDQEDLLKKLQADFESKLKQKELDRESSLKRLKLDHESALATLRMEHSDATRKLQLEHKQVNTTKTGSLPVKPEPDSKKRSLSKKLRLQPITASDNEEVVVKSNSQMKPPRAVDPQRMSHKKKRARTVDEEDGLNPALLTQNDADPFDF